MKTHLAWLCGRTLGLGLLALFTSTHSSQRVDAACWQCQVNKYVDENGQEQQVKTCIQIVGTSGNQTCTGACIMSGSCKS
jgi:hypothetical protein